MVSTFEELENRIAEINASNSDPWPPEMQMLWIMEELGELSAEIMKMRQLQGRFSERKTPFQTEHLQEELGDVLYGLVSIAQNLKLDVVNCLRLSIEKFESRKQNSLS